MKLLNKVLLCGSGPSIDNFDIDYQNYDVMICNSIVKNKNFLEQLNLNT